MPYLATAGLLLIDILFGLVAFIFVIRALLQLVGAPFLNPLCQSIYRLTNPVLTPLRKFFKTWKRLDTSSVFVAFAVLLLQSTLFLIISGYSAPVSAVVILACAELISLVLTLYFWLILIRVLLSWIGSPQHPAIPLLMMITEPVLRKIRRALPAMGGFDLSPILATLAIMLLRILLVAPLQDMAIKLATV